MKRFLLDTGVAGYFIARKRGIFEKALAATAAGNSVGIAHPVLAELAYGAEASRDRDRSQQRLRIALSSWKLWPVTEEATFEYGRIAAELRRKGRVIGQNDMMIAAIALTLSNCTVVTMDGDLSAVAGLSIENWADHAK